MNARVFWYVLSLLLCFSVYSCVDPTDLGSDLLENDQRGVEFFDTLTLKATTVLGEPQFVYGPSVDNQVDDFLWGVMRDSFFGQSSAELYIQPRLDFFNPDFSNSTLDSIILVLPYSPDSTSYYGNIESLYEMEVLRVNELIDRNLFYNSDTSFNFDPQPIAVKQFFPAPGDSTNFVVINGTVKDTVLLPGFVSIRLDDAFGNQILNLDSTSLENDENFLDFLGGLLLRSRTENEGLLSFQLQNTFSGLFVYYTQQRDTITEERQFQIGLDQFSARFPVFSHDYTDAFVENFLDNEELGDSLIFVQGLGGVETRLEIPFLEELRSREILINKAELIIEWDDIDAGSSPLFAPAEQLAVLTRNSASGELEPINDFTIGTLSNNLSGIFGGTLDATGEREGVYSMNISAHFQRMISGAADNFLVISTFPKAERANRSILKGVERGIKLRIFATRL